MKLRLLFLLLLTVNIGLSQNALRQLEDFENSADIDFKLTLLDDTTTTLSKIVTQFNEIQIQEEGFVISPNPSKDKLNIKLPSANKNLKLEVFDVLGKLIYKEEITELESSVNVSNWKSGVYLVRVSSDKGTKTKRFIKE
jgi:hypothetical protein